MTVTVTLSECHYDAAMPVVRCMNFVLLPLTKEEVNVFARVCLSVCLLARLLKNVSMDLDEMLRVDRSFLVGTWMN